MRRFVIAAAAMAALCGGAYAFPSPAPPDEQAQSEAMTAYTALKEDFTKAQKEYYAAYKAATTDEGRMKAGALRPKPDEWSPKFKAIAEKHAADPTAADCWAWIVQNDRMPATQAGALDALLAKHLGSPAVTHVCHALEYSQASNATSFLRTVIEKSADHEAQGRASYTLARILNARAENAGEAKEPEALFERVAEKFADVKYGRGSLAEKAKGDLFEMKNLVVGKVAPEIVGEDENGKAIKLSDFRGKVVLLDFWGFW